MITLSSRPLRNAGKEPLSAWRADIAAAATSGVCGVARAERELPCGEGAAEPAAAPPAAPAEAERVHAGVRSADCRECGLTADTARQSRASRAPVKSPGRRDLSGF